MSQEQEKSKVIASKEIDQILTEAQGKCWHILEHYSSHVKCKLCKNIHINRIYPNTSPTTNWEDYGKVLEWSQEQDWWEKFIRLSYINKVMVTINNKKVHLSAGESIKMAEFSIPNFMLNPETGSRAIATFLEEREDAYK